MRITFCGAAQTVTGSQHLVEHAFLVHGEPDSMTALVPVLQPFVRNAVRMPGMDESVEI